MNNKSKDAVMTRGGKKKRFVFFGVVVAIAAMYGGYQFYTGEENTPQSEARISIVEIGSIENTIAAAGSLQPSEYVDVGAQVSGQLQHLHVEIGDTVEEGQLLAEIDARVQEARVEASRASIEALEAQVSAREASLALARANAERQARLKSADATSQLDYDTAMNALASAESSLIQLQKQIEQNAATLETSETELEYTRIYAPMSGTVVSVSLEEGRTLNAAQQAPTILRIADLGTMTVEADISEADINDIRAGMDVYFTTLGGGDRRWYSEVRQILPTPTIENNVVLYTGLFDIDNGDSSLLPEMTAQVYFVTESAQDVLTIPMGAITFIERPERAARPERDAGAESDGATPEGGIPAGARRLGAAQRPFVGETGDREARDGEARFPAAAMQRRDGSPRLAAEQLGEEPSVRPALVTVVDEEGVQTTRRILVGASSRVRAEVVDGLSEGEQIVSGVIQQRQRPAGQAEGGAPRRPGGFPGGGPF